MTAGEAPPAPRAGPPPEAVARTVRWVTDRIHDWYRGHPPELPARYGRREFGFIPAPRPPPDRTPFFRHIALRSREELHRHLVAEAPWHAYYSTAYYRDPSQSTMKEKEWLGADLIFDLDADHLSEEAKTWPFERQLEAVRKEAVKLLDEFVLGDLGFTEEHVRVVFSGGRGYHVHVTDPRVHAMESAARREVVDYVTGRGVDVAMYVQDDSRGGGVRIPRPTDPAWAGRFTRGLLGRIEHMASLGSPKAIVKYARELGLQGVGERTAESVIRVVNARDATGRTQMDKLREEGRTAHPALAKLVRMQDLGVAGVNEEAGESDEPVTADVKRLIRLPGSVHGKTGLVATPVPLARVADFDPLAEAVAFGDEPVRVVVSRPEPVRVGGYEGTPAEGEQELPMAAAMFLVARRRALVIGGGREG